MLKNYLTTGLRILRRNPAYTAINIFGLSIGIASCMVILMFVVHERSYDDFHENGDRIYRVYRTEYRAQNPVKRSESSASPLSEAIRGSVTGVEKITRYMVDQAQLRGRTQQIDITIAYVDPDFFEMFDFGDAINARVLESPFGIIITQSANDRHFGDSLKVGDTIEYYVSNDVSISQVVAVIPDPPENSSFQFEFVASFASSSFYQQRADSWTAFRPSVYVMKHDEASTAVMEDGLTAVIEANMGEQIAASIEQGWLEDREDAFKLTLQPLSDVHFSSHVDAFNIEVSSSRYSNILLLIAIAILFIACVNFVTQSIGRADTRGREVQMRRSLGADTIQLVQQFLGESLVVTIGATLVAVLLADVLLPVFGRFAGREIPFDLMFSPRMVMISFGLVIACTLTAGLYPAVYLARERFKQVTHVRVGGGNRFIRAVVVAQFGISIAMIASVLVIHGQMRFIDSQDLGFESEELVLVDMNAGRAGATEVADLFQQQLASISGVLSVSGSSSSFGDNWSRTVLSRDDGNHIVYTMRIDPEFLDVTGIDLIAGRGLSSDFGQDADNSILVNRAFVDVLNMEDPVGRYLPELDSVQVVGVVDDFKFLSLREQVPPTLLHMSPDLAEENFTMVRFATGRVVEVMAGLEAAWTAVAPEEPFVAEFLDERLSRLYSEERRWQRIILFSAILAIILSCLGLFGIAAMSANRRMKEIGIRKVLGSSTPELVRLLSTDFAVIVVTAFVLSVPVAWIFLNRWLDSFAYRTSLGPSAFIAAGLITLIIALLTVSHQSLRAALRNPVDVLRSE